MKWNDKRTTLTDWGTEPTLIEPVKGFVILRGIDAAKQIEAVPLDSGAKPSENRCRQRRHRRLPHPDGRTGHTLVPHPYRAVGYALCSKMGFRD